MDDSKRMGLGSIRTQDVIGHCRRWTWGRGTREDDLAGGVDLLGPCDAEPAPDGDDLGAVHEDVGDGVLGGGDDAGVLDGDGNGRTKPGWLQPGFEVGEFGREWQM
jgi:hypothetical protein